MIQARRAPVRPRILSPASGQTVLLEDEIGRMLDQGKSGLVQLAGPPGSGKTTALEHLAAVFPHEARLILVEKPSDLSPGLLIVHTDSAPTARPHLSRYVLAPWDTDDLIEYLLAVHRDRCASVMARLPAAERTFLGGVPQLWTIVLDELARDESIPGARSALHRHLESRIPDAEGREWSRVVCLRLLAQGSSGVLRGAVKRPSSSFSQEVLDLLRHEPVQILLATEWITRDLRVANDCDYFSHRLPRGLITAVAQSIQHDPSAIAHLDRLFADKPAQQAMAASLLLAVNPDWCPLSSNVSSLSGAYLSNARWRNVKLEAANLTGADLASADLTEALLDRCVAAGAILRQARLRVALLRRSAFTGANATEADFSGADAESASFATACLLKAKADGANFQGASFVQADLTDASFRQANLAQAALCAAKLAGTDFTGANFHRANLSGVLLRHAVLDGASFRDADLRKCNLEYMELSDVDFPGANLEEALLTGTRMRRANFEGACLQNAYLADIQWEGASLNRADLRGASFHMGSSRSGLVFSPIACEGSRTGFYTDEFDEQLYKAPEEIRKANLCSVDLRGANIENVDFYLVDLRGAKYDADQAIHLRRSGAILCSRC